VLYDGRAAVVGPRDRGTLERRATVVVTPAAVERVPRRHTLTTRRVDAARRHRHAPYLHRSHVVVTIYSTCYHGIAFSPYFLESPSSLSLR